MDVLDKKASLTVESQKSRFTRGLEAIFGDYKEPKPFQYIDKQIANLIFSITEDYTKMNDYGEKINPTEYIDIDLALVKINELSQELEMLKSFLAKRTI
jgi:hypothetical protein